MLSLCYLFCHVRGVFIMCFILHFSWCYHNVLFLFCSSCCRYVFHFALFRCVFVKFFILHCSWYCRYVLRFALLVVLSLYSSFCIVRVFRYVLHFALFGCYSYGFDSALFFVLSLCISFSIVWDVVVLFFILYCFGCCRYVLHFALFKML